MCHLDISDHYKYFIVSFGWRCSKTIFVVPNGSVYGAGEAADAREEHEE